MTYDKSKKDCPRGFTMQEGKCVPEGAGVDEKLEVKYQRYFFKGEGPMETKRVAEAHDLVDLALDEFETFGKIVVARKQVDRILDGVGKEPEIDYGKGTDVTGRPYDHPKKIRASAEIDECGMMGGGPMNKGIAQPETEEEYEDDYADAAAPPSDGPNDISHVPNQNGKELYASVRKQMLEMQHLDEAAKSKLLGFFTKMLKKWKADPEMDPDEKQALDKNVGRQWKSKKIAEYRDLSEDDKAAYQAYFKKMLAKYGVKSPDELGDKKKEFFNAVDKGWKADHE